MSGSDSGETVGPISPHAEGVVVEVLVVPNASRSEIVGLHGTRLRLRVTASPERGKANQAVAELLTAAFGVSADLLTGKSSRSKRFLLRGLQVGEAALTMDRFAR